MILVAYQRTMAGAKQFVPDTGIQLRKPPLAPVVVPEPRKVLRFMPRPPMPVFIWSRPAKPRYLAVEPLPLSSPRDVIERVVAWHPKVTVEDVIDSSRMRRIIPARFDAIAAVYENCRIDGRRYSLPELGRAFGRDHTSILAALRKRGYRPLDQRQGIHK